MSTMVLAMTVAVRWLLKANIELGLLHHQIGDELRNYLINELPAKLK